MRQLLFTFIHNVAATSNVSCSASSGGCETGLPVVGATSANLQNILQIVFGILAVVAVIMIVIAGIRFITGGNNPQEITKARNTIVFAVVGLIIAISAEAIVSFVLTRA